MNADEKPRAPVPAPPNRRHRGILAPVPETTAPVDNMAKPNSGIQDMNFKVSPELHQAFKVTAAIKGMAMKDLLDACFQCWVEHHGDDQVRAVCAMLPKRE